MINSNFFFNLFLLYIVKNRGKEYGFTGRRHENDL